MEEQFKGLLSEQDEVYCTINQSIEGRIVSKVNYHGMWLYHIEPKEKKEFEKWFGVKAVNAVFLHWQLKKKEGQKK